MIHMHQKIVCFSGKRETVMGYDGTLKKKKYPDCKIAYVQLVRLRLKLVKTSLS